MRAIHEAFSGLQKEPGRSYIHRQARTPQRGSGRTLTLREIGRVERTLFMLDWLESAELRRRCQAGLNKSEQRHFLTGAICTFKQGRIADRTHEAQQFRASGLNLVIAAIVYWNSTYIADAVAHLRANGEPVPDDLLAHTSPVGWGHIAFSGDFLWDRASAMASVRRSLNLGAERLAAYSEKRSVSVLLTAIQITMVPISSI